MIAWRDGRLQTLRQMEQQIDGKLAAFATGVEVRQRVAEAAKAWFDDLRPAIHKLTDPICHEFALPTQTLDITPDTHFSTTPHDASALGEIGLDDLGTVISAVIATVIGMILGGGGIALLHLSLIGQIGAGLIAFRVLYLGKDTVIDAAKDINFFAPLRLIISDARIDAKLDQLEPQLPSSNRSPAVGASPRMPKWLMDPLSVATNGANLKRATLARNGRV